MHRLLFLLSLFTLHSSLFGAPPPQLLRATLVGDNQLAPGATLTVQSGSTLTLASGSTLTAPANLLDWAAVNKTGSSLADLATRPWSALTGTPTTLAGYGITDAYASPLTTAGDLLYGGTAGSPTRLGIGTTGQVLSVSSGGLPAWSTLSGTGTVTSITAGTGLTGGTITSTGTIGLATSGVTAGSYGSASAVPVLTVDATGRITSASTASITAGTGDVTGPSSSTSNQLATFSGTTGKILSSSPAWSTIPVPLTVGDGAGTTAAERQLNVIGSAAVVRVLRTASSSPAVELMSASTYSSTPTAYWDFYVAPSDVFAIRRRTGEANADGLRLYAGYVSVPTTTASTSPTTGALIVSGGAGIAGRTSTGTLSISTTGTACDGLWSATATLDFGSIAAASQADLTITVTGASVGDSVSLGLPAAPTSGIVFNAFVSAANTVTIRATNTTAAAIDPASATYRATVMSF